MGADEARQIVERAIQREDLSIAARPADREVPAFPVLGSEEREFPALERWAPAFDCGTHGVAHRHAGGSVDNLRTVHGDGHSSFGRPLRRKLIRYANLVVALDSSLAVSALSSGM